MTAEQQRDLTAGLSDPRRLAALTASGMLDSEAEPAFDRATRLATRIVGSPVSLLSFVDDSRQFFKAQHGLTGQAAEDRGAPLSHSFCQYVVLNNAPFIVPDARKNPLVRDNHAIKDLGVIAYIGVPVRASNGAVLGSFCAIDQKPHEWDESELEALKDLAAMIEAELALRETVEEREIVLQEMNHRVNNLFSVVAGIIRMERRDHDEISGFAQSLSARLQALGDAHQMIVPVINAGQAGQTGAALYELITKILAPYRDNTVGTITIKGDPVTVGAKSVVPLTLALHEMATNAVKYGALARNGSTLDVTWYICGKHVQIDWVESNLAQNENTPPSGGGFGSRLLSMTLEGQLEGVLETRMDGDQFSQRVTIALSTLGL